MGDKKKNSAKSNGLYDIDFKKNDSSAHKNNANNASNDICVVSSDDKRTKADTRTVSNT